MFLHLHGIRVVNHSIQELLIFLPNLPQNMCRLTASMSLRPSLLGCSWEAHIMEEIEEEDKQLPGRTICLGRIGGGAFSLYSS